MEKENPEILRQFLELVHHPAWGHLLKMAENQVAHRRNRWNLTPTDPTSIYQQQWELGEAAGIHLFMRLPQDYINSQQEALKHEQRSV